MEKDTIEITSFADIEPVDVDIEESKPAIIEAEVPVVEEKSTEEVKAEPVEPIVEARKEKAIAKKKEQTKSIVEARKEKAIAKKKEQPASTLSKPELEEVDVQHKLYKGKAYVSSVELPGMEQEYKCLKIANKYYYYK